MAWEHSLCVVHLWAPNRRPLRPDSSAVRPQGCPMVPGRIAEVAAGPEMVSVEVVVASIAKVSDRWP